MAQNQNQKKTRKKTYTARLDLPLTPEQLVQITAQAQAHGLPVTIYVRAILFNSMSVSSSNQSDT